MSLMLL
jgi:hypothetical protein